MWKTFGLKGKRMVQSVKSSPWSKKPRQTISQVWHSTFSKKFLKCFCAFGGRGFPMSMSHRTRWYTGVVVTDFESTEEFRFWTDFLLFVQSFPLSPLLLIYSIPLLMYCEGRDFILRPSLWGGEVRTESPNPSHRETFSCHISCHNFSHN